LQNDINTKIISIDGPYKDPDEAIKADPKNWERAIQNSKPSLEYWIDLLVRKNPDLSVLTKKSIAKEILPVIKTIFSDIEKEYYIKYLAKKLSVAEKTILSTLEKTKKVEGVHAKEESKQVALKLGIFEKIVGIIWSYPDLISKCKNMTELISDDDKLDSFVSMINNKKIVKSRIEPEAAVILDQYAMVALEEVQNNDLDIIRSELEFLFARMRSEKKEDLKTDFAKQIEIAEQSGDRKKVKKLLSEFSNLIK
jgi:DNA primase